MIWKAKETSYLRRRNRTHHDNFPRKMPFPRAIFRKTCLSWVQTALLAKKRNLKAKEWKFSKSRQIGNFSSNLSHKGNDKQTKFSEKSAFLNLHFCIYQFQLVPREFILNATERTNWEYDKIIFLAYFKNLKQYFFTWSSKLRFLTLIFASRRTKVFKSYTLVLDLSNSGQKDDWKQKSLAKLGCQEHN